MRLPNGFGNVSKLSGKRRNPWRARKTSGWVIDEKTKKAKQTYITITPVFAAVIVEILTETL